jgi:hypothetical protein
MKAPIIALACAIFAAAPGAAQQQPAKPALRDIARQPTIQTPQATADTQAQIRAIREKYQKQLDAERQQMDSTRARMRRELAPLLPNAGRPMRRMAMMGMGRAGRGARGSMMMTGRGGRMMMMGRPGGGRVMMGRRGMAPGRIGARPMFRRGPAFARRPARPLAAPRALPPRGGRGAMRAPARPAAPDSVPAQQAVPGRGGRGAGRGRMMAPPAAAAAPRARTDTTAA